MNHPFDDFLPPSWHRKRADRRVIRVGIVLVAVVTIATATAFATTLTSWNSLLRDRSSIAAKWEDARLRVDAYLHAQKEIESTIESTSTLERLTDSVPRSLLLWEVSQLLPEQAKLVDIRLEIKTRPQKDADPIVTETITLLGTALTDATVSTYIDNLSSSEYFSSTSLMYAQQDKNGPNRIFSVQLIVNNEVIIPMGAAK